MDYVHGCGKSDLDKISRSEICMVRTMFLYFYRNNIVFFTDLFIYIYVYVTIIYMYIYYNNY